MIEAVIFDMDGVLLDNEWIYKCVLKRIFKRYLITLSDEYFNNLTGLTLENGGASKIIKTFDLRVEEQKLIDTVYDLYSEYEDEMKMNPGVLETISQLKANNIQIGLATSTIRKKAEPRLKNLNLFSLLDVMVFGDEVPLSKPWPDIYIECLKRLKVSSEKVAVFEDSTNGVRAAVGANISLIFGVLHEHNNEKLLLESGAIKVGFPPIIFYEALRVVFSEEH